MTEESEVGPGDVGEGGRSQTDAFGDATKAAVEDIERYRIRIEITFLLRTFVPFAILAVTQAPNLATPWNKATFVGATVLEFILPDKGLGIGFESWL